VEDLARPLNDDLRPMSKRIPLILLFILLAGGVGFGLWMYLRNKSANVQEKSPVVSPNSSSTVSSSAASLRVVSPVSSGIRSSDPSVHDELLDSPDQATDPDVRRAFAYQPFTSSSNGSAVPATTSTPPKKPNGNSDTDKDGLTADQEMQFGTDPDRPDTDGDGLLDGEEVHTYKTNPKNFDTDGDGLTDGEEVRIDKTDPNKADTDGDGYSDGVEVKGGYNPLGPGKLN
jgi:hypothetical protein